MRLSVECRVGDSQSDKIHVEETCTLQTSSDQKKKLQLMIKA